MSTKQTVAPVPEPRRGRIGSALGESPVEWTVEDLSDLVEKEGIRLVSLMHVGGDGWLKALDFVPLSRAHLEDVLAAGERADGSSLFADTGLPVGASDILLRPRPETAFLDPFASEPTLAVLCHHLDRNGELLDVSPSSIVRAAARRVREMTGIELLALGEVEYFLGKRPQEGDVYGSDDRGYHATAPFVFGAEMRRRAMSLLGEIGVAVKYGHSEVGYIEASEADGRIWEQHEIELALAPLERAADAVVLTQWVLRNLAHHDGLRCSFDPIVRKGHAGSGMHFHFSPMRDGVHLGGVDETEELSDAARWLIAGLVRHGGALMAFGNRMEESFVRLLQAKEAPETITWGRYNRHALVRLPILARAPDGRVASPPTVEFRLPDGSVHPHLLLAGIAQVFLAASEQQDGLSAVLAHARAGTADPAHLRSVPRSFREVAAELREHRSLLEAAGVFPATLIDRTLEILTRV